MPGAAVRVQVIGEAAWQIRLGGDDWKQSIHHPTAALTPTAPELVADVRRIMAARLDLAATRGCDGVEPDNVDGYSNKNGLGLTPDDQLDYNRYIADQAHQRGLAVALKNDLDQVAALEPSFDFAVNEQCNQYKECAKLKPFTTAGKAIFNAEYAAKYKKAGEQATLCDASRAADIRTLVLAKKLNDSYRYSCD